MKIVMDTAGGDKSPRANVEGAVLAMKKHPEITTVFTGDEETVRALLRETGAPEDRVEVIHAPGVITGEDKPTDAIRLKRDSSMIRAIRLLREDKEVSALISTGATGALVAAATLRIGRLRGVRRPAFCPLLPTMNGGIVGVCDSGANVDILPEQLVEFAVMGTEYLSAVYGIEKPRVALLNVGTESEKGDDLHKAGYRLLSGAPGINFTGNMESRDLLSGKYDLVVSDGFSGNVLIKATEGTALELLKKLKKDISSKKRYMLGALFMKRMFLEEKEFMNYQNYGGSVLLGAEKIVVKGHGSSDAAAVEKCVEQAWKMQKADMNARIERSLAAVDEAGINQTNQEKENEHV
ncbi:MAG: phosphate acyltransferase PlsX [Clostridia bacterium]|nr:phosphate acyltransferase PlsX [Clostridia bacterium]